MTTVTAQSSAKVNLLLHILNKTPDGFHDLETLIWPVDLLDDLTFELLDDSLEGGIRIECTDPSVPVDSSNLVHRAISLFYDTIEVAKRKSVRVRLQKRIPSEAGLGGGSGNAAVALLAMNRLYDDLLDPSVLHRLASQLGSDVPFFLNPEPALGEGRGDRLRSLKEYGGLASHWILLMRPAFGVSTAWAYGRLSYFPGAIQGSSGRAIQVLKHLEAKEMDAFFEGCINTLEIPVFHKYPYLKMACDWMKERGARLSRMSGSGSTLFSIWDTRKEAEEAWQTFQSQVGGMQWHHTCQLHSPAVILAPLSS